MSTDIQISMLDELQSRLVEKITQAGILERPEFESQRKKLKKSYENLHLAITAHKAETTEKLCHIRRGRNIVETYRGNF